MAILGHLDTVSLPEVFSFLHQLRKTGTLCIVSENQERCFVFQGGNIVYATAKDTTKLLGHYLVKLDLLTQEELDEVLLAAAQARCFFGQLLLERERLTAEELGRVVRVQMMDILEETFAWPHGAFHFDDNKTPFQLPTGANISTQSVLFEVTSKWDEWKKVKELFPDTSMIVKRCRVTRSVQLTREEKDILDLVDGDRSVSQIFLRSPTKDLRTAVALTRLKEEGLLTLAGPRVECTDAKPTPELHFLPVSPKVPGKIFSIFSGERCLRDELTAVIAQDPMLAAKLLRALVASGSRIDRGRLSVEYIIESLTPFDLRSQLLPEAIRGLFFPNPECFWKEYWEHSLFCARIGQHVAAQVSYPAPGEAYLAGLLHNLGVFILMSQDPAKYREVASDALENQTDILMLEEQYFGISHARIGGVYADRWGFPTSISQVIKYHHDVDGKITSPLLHILCVAHNVALELGVGVEHSLAGARQLRISLTQLDLDLRQVVEDAGRLWSSREPSTLVLDGPPTLGSTPKGH